MAAERTEETELAARNHHQDHAPAVRHWEPPAYHLGGPSIGM
ncbi:hypothetical protein [Streptomyces phytohabitans]